MPYSLNDWDDEFQKLSDEHQQQQQQQQHTSSSSSSTTTTNANNDLLRVIQSTCLRLSNHLENRIRPICSEQEYQQRKQNLDQINNTLMNNNNNNNTSLSTPPPPSSPYSLAISQQDSIIDELAGGLSRLKTQSRAMNDEASMHLNLLHGMDDRIDHTHATLGQNSDTIRRQQTHGSCAIWKLQIVVAGLSVSLVLLVLLGLVWTDNAHQTKQMERRYHEP